MSLEVNKRCKIWTCCLKQDYHIGMQYVCFDEKVTATNGHVLVKIEYDTLFPYITEREKKQLQGKLLHGDYLSKLAGLRRGYNVTINNDVIVAAYGDMRITYRLMTREQLKERKQSFPPVESINRTFRSAKGGAQKEFHEMALNVDCLKMIADAFDIDCLKMKITSATNAIIIEPNDICSYGMEALIMPVLVKE